VRLFKSTYKDRKGRTRETSRWYVEFTDQNNILRRWPAFTSKAATDELGRNLEKLVGYHRATGGQTDPALEKWLTTLPADIRAKLIEVGLIDGKRVSAARPLSEHLDDYEKVLKAKGNTPGHVQLTKARINRVFEGCGFRFYVDISGAAVADFLDGLRQDVATEEGETKRGISAASFNYYLGAVKSFCRWMVRERRATENPVGHLDPLNAKLDRRHDRRAPSADELRVLLTVTESEPERFGMSGPARAMLYQLAAETGLRANELRSLTAASFDLNETEPTVTVAAGYSKRRRQDCLPLVGKTAKALQEFIKGKTGGASVFRMPASGNVVKMLREDLEAARVEWLKAAGTPEDRQECEASSFLKYADDAGRVFDFHALRHGFITNLAAGGVAPKTAQALARHSTITLTLDRYTHQIAGDQTAALMALPDLSIRPAVQEQQANGTDHGRAVNATSMSERLSVCLSSRNRLQATLRGADRREPIQADSGRSDEKPYSRAQKRGSRGQECGSEELGRAGVEPATHGFSVRCSTN